MFLIVKDFSIQTLPQVSGFMGGDILGATISVDFENQPERTLLIDLRGSIMRSSIAESITSTVKDLKKSGLVDEITMKNIQSLCVPAVKDYKPEKIVSLRKKFNLSQAALAYIFNISPSTVQKMGTGE